MRDQRRRSITVLVPAHDEAANITQLCEALFSVLDPLPYQATICFVDDGSKDDTWQRIEEARRRFQRRVSGLRLSRNFGKEAALLAGLEHVDADAVITMDCDLQHPVDRVPTLIEAWQAGYAIVDGVKAERGRERLVYRSLVPIFYGALRLLTGQSLEGSSDFKLLDRRVVQTLRGFRERRFFYRAAVASLGFRRIEVPFAVAPRSRGTSSFSLRKLFGLVMVALTTSAVAPVRLLTATGGAFLLVALVLGAISAYQKAVGVAMPGFTTVILLQLITGGVLLGGLGTLGEYIAAILEEVRARPRYIIEWRSELGESAPGTSSEEPQPAAELEGADRVG